ncbi:hypothetical protein TSMEX_009337 [Taenia solium]|eukprot:TsM_000390200 transcript=TsM_000390200 gene=TsM_000390200
MKDAPCKLNSIGFQDIFSFNSSSSDKEKQKFVGTLSECVTADSVVILYCCLGLIILSFLCSLFQLFTNLNINFGFIKKFRRRGLLDVCCGGPFAEQFLLTCRDVLRWEPPPLVLDLLLI